MEPKFKALQEILELREFPDVFPEDLLGLPLEREIFVCIKLKLSSVPIYKASYRMLPAKLKELKSQLQEVFNKVFIRPSLYRPDELGVLGLPILVRSGIHR
jgi:hypothetical protein